MLCVKGHNNSDDAKFCNLCGTSEFQSGTSNGVAASGSLNGLAIASMVLGIVWIYWIGSILALVFGYVSRRQIKKTGQKGEGFALAGIVLGWVGVGILVLVIILAIAATSNQTTNFN
jgi:hypothetical protein